MLRLIKNEFRLNRAWLLFLFLLMVLIGALPWTPTRGAFSGLLLGVGMGNLMVVVILSRQAYYRSDLLYRTAPLDTATTVAANYAVIAILVFGCAAYGFLFRDLVDLITGTPFNHHQFDNGYPVVHSLIVRVVSWWLLVAIALPISIQYGTVLRIIVGYVVAGTLHTIATFPLLKVSASAAASLGLNAWISLVMVLFILSGILSVIISARVLRRKEF